MVELRAEVKVEKKVANLAALKVLQLVILMVAEKVEYLAEKLADH